MYTLSFWFYSKGTMMMLVLNQKVGQSIDINDEITITILQNQPGRIRIGIEAPKKYKVVRNELLLSSKNKS